MTAQYNERASVHIQNLAGEVDEDLLFELGVQFGEVVRVNIPVNKMTMQRERFGFIEFRSPADAEYMRDVVMHSRHPLQLFNQTVQIRYKGDQQTVRSDALLDIGARIVVGPLSARGTDLDTLRLHFANFGPIAQPPKLDIEAGGVDATATVCFTTFEAADAAIAATNNKFLFDRRVHAQYAMREDGTGRHGSAEERKYYEQAAVSGGAPAAPFVPQKLQQQQQQQQQASTAVAGQPSWAQGLNPFQGAK